MKKNRVKVAEYLAQQIALSGVAQKDISEAIGYDKPNIITMFKQGKTKIPLNKIAPLSHVLGVNPVHFLRLAMLEYSPETWEVLESLIGGNGLTSSNEMKILDIAREASGGIDIAPKTPDQEKELYDLFSSWADREISLAKPATSEKL